MVHLTILRDNREQLPWEFDDFDVSVKDVTINTGDYTLAEFCDHDKRNDTYHPRYAVERKGGEDFIQSITYSRDRFEEEIKRASDWDSPLLVLIEEPETTFRRMRGFMEHHPKIVPKQIFGTIDSWERYYNVKFKFTGTRGRAQQEVVDSFSSRLRAILTE